MPLAPEISALIELLRDAPAELTGGPNVPVEEARALHEAGAAMATPSEERATVAAVEGTDERAIARGGTAAPSSADHERSTTA